MLREGELCAEAGPWGLRVTPSFPRLGSIFTYLSSTDSPEDGWGGGGWGARRCTDALFMCGVASPQAPGPRWEGAAVPLPEAGAPLQSRRVQGALTRGGVGKCSGAGGGEGLWAESPS